MSFLKKLFGKKEPPVKTYAEFWAWFQQHASTFHAAVKSREKIEARFFNQLSPQLDSLKEGFFFLTGMDDEHTAELILTADGNTKQIVFVEELVAAAPAIPGWKFTALKPATSNNSSISMDGMEFNEDNLFFYANELPAYPDEIDICIVHNEMTDENKEAIIHGTYIFLDNYLGELDFLNNIDQLEIITPGEAEKELVPVSKLKAYLNWRQKEFIEKYEGERYDTDNDTYSILEAELENGNMLIAMINTQLLEWDRQASHPWIAVMEIKYDGKNTNGMPTDIDADLMNTLEEEMAMTLVDKDGYLNVGRQTANSERTIFFACKDFRLPSKVMHETAQRYEKQFEIGFDIYKDKYWQTFERFKQH